MNRLETLVNKFFVVEATFSNELESFDLLEFTARLNYTGTINDKVYFEIISYVGDDDKLSLIYDDGDNTTDSSRVQQEDFLRTIKGTLSKTTVTLTVRISKKITNGLMIVYDYSWFLKFLQSLSLKSIFSVFGKKYSEGVRKVVFKGVNIGSRMESRDLMFCSEDITDIPSKMNIEEADKKIKEMKSCCHWDDTSDNVMTPDTLMFSEMANTEFNGMKVIFDKMCFYQTIRFIYDYTTLTDLEFRYHISGYRVISGDVACGKVSAMEPVNKSLPIFYSIYKWIYNEGNIADKLGIARNIITINGKGDNLDISDSTIQAIRSNFNIYSQKYVGRYIEVRNQLSKIFLDLSKQMNTIADGYESEFNNSFKALATFFMSIIVLKAVSGTDKLIGFNLSISLLSLIFIMISFFIKKHAKNTYEEKMRMLHKYVVDLKERYKNILTEEESVELFKDLETAQVKPDNHDRNDNVRSYRSIVEERQQKSNKNWDIFLFLLMLAIVVIISVNGIQDISNNPEVVGKLIGGIKLFASFLSLIVVVCFKS